MKSEFSTSKSGIIGKIDEMFPLDWEILRQAPARSRMKKIGLWMIAKILSSISVFVFRMSRCMT